MVVFFHSCSALSTPVSCTLCKDVKIELVGKCIPPYFFFYPKSTSRFYLQTTFLFLNYLPRLHWKIVRIRFRCPWVITSGCRYPSGKTVQFLFYGGPTCVLPSLPASPCPTSYMARRWGADVPTMPAQGGPHSRREAIHGVFVSHA